MLFGIPTVDKIWCAIMDAVVMAIVAQALPVVYIVAQFREILYGLDMVGFQIFMAPAILTSKSIALKHGFFPGKIIGASPALRIPTIAPLGHALTFFAAIRLVIQLIKSAINQAGVWAAKFLATNGTSAKRSVGKDATATRAVHRAANVRWWAQQFFAAVFTDDGNFPRLRGGATFTAAKSFLGILGPRAIRLLGDNRAAHFARFQFHTTIIARV